MRPFFQLILMQFREFYREPGVIFWSLAFPVLMAWGLGIAFTQQGELVRSIAWVQVQPRHGVVQNFINPIADSSIVSSLHEQNKTLGNDRMGSTTYRFIKTDWEGAERMIKRGQASLIVYEKGDSVSYFFDPHNPEGQLAFLQISSAMRDPGAMMSENIRTFSQTGMRYIDFLVPGLMAMNIMFGGLWGISYWLIEKRSKKLLRRMVATPMNKGALLFSLIVARLVLSVAESALLWIFAWWYFDLSIEGSLAALFALLVAGNVVFFGIAVLLSSRTANTQIGNGLINAVSMPMMICSGIFFSYHNFPEWLVGVIRYLPLTIIADHMRGICIEGAGFLDVLSSLGILIGSGLLYFLIGKRYYKWY